jgi:hypothetical protein
VAGRPHRPAQPAGPRGRHYTEPYDQDGARVAVDHATSRGAKNLDQLLAGLADTDLDIDTAVRKGTLSRYRSFATAVGEQLSGRWAFEDTHASYILLDGVALGDDTPRLARHLLEDFRPHQRRDADDLHDHRQRQSGPVALGVSRGPT